MFLSPLKKRKLYEDYIMFRKALPIIHLHDAIDETDFEIFHDFRGGHLKYF